MNSPRNLKRDHDVGVEVQTRLPRLLVITVDGTWAALPAERRVRAAEEWYTLWREAMQQGVLAIVDPKGASQIGFDAFGRAHIP